jgi:hypothetical protein
MLDTLEVYLPIYLKVLVIHPSLISLLTRRGNFYKTWKILSIRHCTSIMPKEVAHPHKILP